MAIQRLPAYWQSGPHRSSNLTLYNSPGSGQFKWIWHSFLIPHTGILRELGYRIDTVSGSPTLRWTVYDQLPANENINSLTPIASGDISTFPTPFATLSSNLGLSVTRGQPIAVKLGCIAGTSFNVQGGANNAPAFGICNPGGTVFGSTDDSTYATVGSNHFKHTFTMTMTIEDGDGTYRFMTSFTAGAYAVNNMNSTSTIQAHSFRIGRPIIVSGFGIPVYPVSSPLTLGTLRFELRRNNSDFTPVMTGSPIAYREYSAVNFTYAGIDTRIDVLFDDVLISDGNFCLLYYWTTYTQGNIQARFYYTETSYVDAMLGSVYKELYSSNGGSSWTSSSRVPPMEIMWRQFADSYSSGGKKIIPAPILGGF